jgi:hypothetical protein
MSLADELEKLAGEADKQEWALEGPMDALAEWVLDNLPTILCALREREAAQELPTPPLER